MTPVTRRWWRVPKGAPGMTLRQYYAGQTMPGILAGGVHPETNVAELAVAQADRLLVELMRS